MRVVVLTTVPFGPASRSLPALCADPRIEVAAVILAEQHTVKRAAALKRKLRKIARIGPLGAFNGVRLRRWYADEGVPHIASVAAAQGVPLLRTPAMNMDTTRALLRELAPDVALSLGNSYIAESVFSIPRLGTANLHMELLPEYQGGLSVLWPIYFGRTRSGFTIHRMDRSIDTGEILLRRELDIRFGPTLEQTVRATLASVRGEVPGALCDVCARYEELLAHARPQARGRSFTTPTWREFRRMRANHGRLASSVPLAVSADPA